MADSETNGALHQDFRERVIEGIGALKTQLATVIVSMEDLKERVNRINGSVAAVTQRANVLDINLTAHPLTCPVRKDMEEIGNNLGALEDTFTKENGLLKDAITALTAGRVAAKEVNKKWWDRVMPFVYLAAGAMIVLFLTHADDLLIRGIVKP